MANLQAVYSEFGLSGLIPYALRPGTKGQQIVIEKIKGGDPLYLIKSSLNAPYLIIKDGIYHAIAFSTMAAAEEKQHQLSAQRLETAIETMPSGPGRESEFLNICDDGATALLIDDAATIRLDQLAQLPTYDGQPNEEHLLRNQALNGNLFYFLQIACAQMSNAEAEKRWAQSMVSSRFLLVVEDSAADDYPLLTTTVKSRPCFLAYTDWHQLRMSFETVPAGLTVSFDELCHILSMSDNHAILLNQSSCHLVLDSDMMLAIRQVLNAAIFGQPKPILDFGAGKGTSTPALVQITEEDWETADPTPDWLK